jgi:AraC-like DNA-binding protein
MLAWSPILIQKIEISALGFVLRKLQLNRHREAEVASHTHPYTQLILYLSGEGWQTIKERKRDAHAGDLFVIPPNVPHGFSQQGTSRPLCLVLDYDLKDRDRTRSSHRKLPQSTLNELHDLLARVPRKGRLTLSDYPPIIAVIARLLESSPEQAAPAGPVPLFERVSTLLRTPTPLAVVAKETGYQPDYLNRKLKRETGVGLRALRDRLRLEAAQQSLRSDATIADAAARAGFEDPNYFARWFRKQTGSTPSDWRRT